MGITKAKWAESSMSATESSNKGSSISATSTSVAAMIPGLSPVFTVSRIAPPSILEQLNNLMPKCG